jgi:multisubunit Na+/H+ antiporter MnhG subunit
MGLDIRLPIGLMFTLIGALLVIQGFITQNDAEMYKRSLGSNINLIWGGFLLCFGVFMLVLAWFGAKAAKEQAPDATKK